MTQNIDQTSNSNPFASIPGLGSLIPFHSSRRNLTNQAHVGYSASSAVPTNSENPISHTNTSTNTTDVQNSNGGGGGHAPLPSHVYNLTNANDVVIGPMTQYRGPVTIYQHLDANFDSARIGGGPIGGTYTFDKILMFVLR